jgi:LacI family transcriptional regulator, galactose operon repressor
MPPKLTVFDPPDRKKSMQHATMRDVAALADVSVKTVSRVINGEKYISPAIAERVKKAVHRLGYRHNLAASQLRAGARSAAIGIILVDISNPFSSMVHRAIEDTFRESGVAVLSASTDEQADREQTAVRAFSMRRVDGLIIMPASHDQSYLQQEISNGMHVVIIDRPPAFLNVDSVVSANRDGARAGVEHLIAGGHRRIGLIGDWSEVASSRLRYEGYADALTEHRIGLDPDIVRQGFTGPPAVEEATRSLLEARDPPSALFISQNALCLPAIRALDALGRQHSVAIVAFDGFEGADLINPGLTVVTQDPVQMGRTAARMLQRRMGGDQSPPQNQLLPTPLIRRGSGEIPGPFAPVADPPTLAPRANL